MFDVNMMLPVAVGIATYISVGAPLIKAPDPSTQCDMSLNAMMACLIALNASFVALAIVFVLGEPGYLITAVILPVAIRKIVKELTKSEKVTVP